MRFLFHKKKIMHIYIYIFVYNRTKRFLFSTAARVKLPTVVQAIAMFGQHDRMVQTENETVVCTIIVRAQFVRPKVVFSSDTSNGTSAFKTACKARMRVYCPSQFH